MKESFFFILLLSNLFITTRLNLQHREKRGTQLLVEDVSAGIHLSLYSGVVNIGLAEIFYWFNHVRGRALMQSGVVIVSPPVEKEKGIKRGLSPNPSRNASSDRSWVVGVENDPRYTS